ncbi:MAG: helix-turn-helix domain-containing protein [Algoriphagus sp.]|uniref:helix-turn-helix domain-containing protein n=1 Tax=Algoriphagus sp. TaxID=1872435 RepID=UPI0017F004F3|nr:helix-turn-helix domain-containing protein [Algoriphagus sp.]NVJ86507.1 helix-turn-helix domain-containing protein [Algoriphagus sp.]
MRLLLTLLSFLLLWNSAFSQDTLFVNKHQFISPVQNVFDAEGRVFVKTTGQLFQLEGDNWIPFEQQFSKPYVFFKDNFYESDFIPNSELFDIYPIKELVPQRGKFIATAARVGSRFFVASGSELFEYEIRDHYTKTYHNRSIRDIFLEDSLKVISTYSGIYVNDTIRLKEILYSNGPLSKIGGKYYFAWDEISLFFPPDSVFLIPNGTSRFSGKARKIISSGEDLYTLHTQAVSKVLPGFELQPIHQGLEYLDLEEFQDGLVFSTFQGVCLKWDGNRIDTLAVLPAKVKDIYPVGDRLILSSDSGVFEWKDEENEPKKLADTPFAVMSTLDDFNNLWIATENGLYVLTPDFPDPVIIIPNVEFNREALLLQSEMLYAGAVDGLYTLNTYEIEKSYLPNILNTLQVSKNERKSMWIVGAFILVFISVGGYLFYMKKKKERVLNLRKSGAEEWNLKDLEQRVIQEKILTVEGLATALDTNTVQLNRNFKKMGITPGKFLKKVKLKQAKQLLDSGSSIEEVSKSIGYSEKLIKSELGRD